MPLRVIVGSDPTTRQLMAEVHAPEQRHNPVAFALRHEDGRISVQLITATELGPELVLDEFIAALQRAREELA